MGCSVGQIFVWAFTPTFSFMENVDMRKLAGSPIETWTRYLLTAPVAVSALTWSCPTYSQQGEKKHCKMKVSSGLCHISSPTPASHTLSANVWNGVCWMHVYVCVCPCVWVHINAGACPWLIQTDMFEVVHQRLPRWPWCAASLCASLSGWSDWTATASVLAYWLVCFWGFAVFLRSDVVVPMKYV